MSKEKTHDLHDFMQQKSDWLAAEYCRIQRRVPEDPGTAGDQGEENWATLLRDWLPQTYHVKTKGRIISQNGEASPQIDVLVLKSIYPKQLIDENQKTFLAAGVAAAFECKTTLKAAYIDEAIETCVKIKNLYPPREGTPYKELHAPIVYGLLAHSHNWKAPNSTPEANVRNKLSESDHSHVSHPRLGLDFLCVADLATWTAFKSSLVFPQTIPRDSPLRLLTDGPDKFALSSYHERLPFPPNQAKHFTSIGAFISNLTERLAWEDPALRDLADYYRSVKITGSGKGPLRLWLTSIYSKKIRARVEAGNLSGSAGNEWSLIFP